MNIKSYWDQSLTYEEYLNLTKKLVENPELQQEDYQDYYALGLQRMERVAKTYTPQREDLQKMQSKNFKGNVLIITEPWCGDASSIVPVLAKFLTAAEVPVRLFLRDSDPSLINAYLTDNAQAIPKVLVIDENYEVMTTWGPRPKFGTDLLHKFKADPENYPREEFYNDLQKAYAKDKGKEIVAEILSLIP